jgi:5'-nucleotidase
MHARRLLAAAAAATIAFTATAAAGGATGNRKPPPIRHRSVVEVQILGLNDFHGNIEPPSGSSGRVGTVDAGGAEYLATHIRALEATNRNTIVVSAGDLIGASPLTSALFHDEPTIEAMNSIGLDLNAVGNHEFDEGATELLRMQEGGCHPVDGCFGGDGFRGADFDFLAANVVSEDTGRPIFPPYSIENFQGARVAFIGMTLEGTPTIVSQAGIAGLEFRDEADTVNRLVPHLRRRGVEAIVVLLHEGGFPTATDPNGCPVSGPIVDITDRMSDEVDLIISGHTHQAYNCVIDGTPVTSAFSFGRIVTDVDLRVDRRSGDVVGLAINNRIVDRTVTRDSAITALIERYRVLAAPIANREIGRITADITRAVDASRESSLGNAIADAQLAATDGPAEGAAVLGLMNPGGVRADLSYVSSAVGEGDGVVTYGEAFTVQPFGNSLVTMTLTGAQIERVLEEQFCGVNSPGSPRVLSPSAGFHYAWSDDPVVVPCDVADRIDPTSITLGGQPLDLAASYRVTVNSFLADGGDGFATLAQGTNRVGGAVDVDAFEAYLVAAGPTGLAPPATDRIDVAP